MCRGDYSRPESTHAIAGALDFIRSGEARDGQVLLIGLSGNGVLDLAAYHQVLKK